MSEPGKFWENYAAYGETVVSEAQGKAAVYLRGLGFTGPLVEPTAGGWTNENGSPTLVSVMKKEITPGITAVVELVGAGILGLRPWGYLLGPEATRRGVANLAVQDGFKYSAAEKLKKLAQVRTPTELQGLEFRVNEMKHHQNVPA